MHISFFIYLKHFNVTFPPNLGFHVSQHSKLLNSALKMYIKEQLKTS